MQLIVMLLLLVILTLAGISLVLLIYYLKINKTINIFLEKGNIKDAKELLFSQVEKTRELEVMLKECISNIHSLENIAKISLQKIGIVRFSPFGQVGGNQSFSVALLDAQNNGVVMLSLFIKDGHRTYAKKVTNGTCEYALLDEEKEAIARALGNIKS